MTSALGSGGTRRAGDLLLIVLLAGVSPAFLIAASIAEPYAATALGMASDDAIWFAECFLVGTLLVMPLSGVLLTRYGFVAVMLVALAGSLLSAVAVIALDLLALARDQGPVLVAVFLAGAFSAPLAPAAQAFAVRPMRPRNAARPWPSGVWGATSASC